MHRPAGRRRRLVRALAAACCGACTALAHAGGDPSAWAAEADAQVTRGENAPQEAAAALRALAARSPLPPGTTRRALALDLGVIAAVNGDAPEVRRQVDALQALARAGEPQAQADAHLVRAEQALAEGRLLDAHQEASAALGPLADACRPELRPYPACDYRGWWRALQELENSTEGQGRQVVARSQALAMLDLARRAGDRPREAMSLAVQALVVQDDDEAAANGLMAQAARLVDRDAAPWLRAWLALYAGVLHQHQHRAALEARDFESGLAIARAARLPRTELMLRADLSDVLVAEGRPAQALTQVAQALPVARRLHDLRGERVLRHNAVLANLALGRTAAARAELPIVLDLLHRTAGKGQQAGALRELSDALGRAGDDADALDLYHQERALTVEIQAANRRAAEAEMRAKYDQDAQRRRIELLARDNELKSARIANEALQQRQWMFGEAALALLAVLAALGYLRLRELHRDLVRREALLRSHRERDALTGLANRRQVSEVMRLRRGDDDFRGALMMIDIDHFKQVNDGHGHAAGDGVLVEVARRLATGVRAGDLVARWGGEEFLVYAPQIGGTELDQLAARLRAAVADQPVRLEDGRGVAVTVSIGYAGFPMPGTELAVGWERAARLADLALYAAKDRGRDCAVGLVRIDAATSEALRRVEADLARACADGLAALRITPARD